MCRKVYLDGVKLLYLLNDLLYITVMHSTGRRSDQIKHALTCDKPTTIYSAVHHVIWTLKDF